MSEHDRRLAELLADAVEPVEPSYRLDAIRASARTPSRRLWHYALAGTAAAAAVVVAVAVVGSRTDQQPLGPAVPEPAPTATEPPLPSGGTTVPVYYVGDTAGGPRLFRELRRLAGSDPLELAVEAALGRAPDGSGLRPLDPDYRSAWPAGTSARTSFDGVGVDGGLTIDLGGEGSLRERPDGLDPEEAGMAVEQLVWTAQAAARVRAPVRILLDGRPTDQVLGVPVAEPLATGPTLQVLNRVSLTSPEQDATVTGDVLEVRGVANSVEATVGWELLRDGEPVRTGHATADGWMEERLFPFATSIDVSGLPSGSYTLVASTSDPSGGQEGDGPQVDTRDVTLE